MLTSKIYTTKGVGPKDGLISLLTTPIQQVAYPESPDSTSSLPLALQLWCDAKFYIIATLNRKRAICRGGIGTDSVFYLR
jgi:hypothetical protein